MSAGTSYLGINVAFCQSSGFMLITHTGIGVCTVRPDIGLTKYLLNQYICTTATTLDSVIACIIENEKRNTKCNGNRKVIRKQ